MITQPNNELSHLFAESMSESNEGHQAVRLHDYYSDFDNGSSCEQRTMNQSYSLQVMRRKTVIRRTQGLKLLKHQSTIEPDMYGQC